jgi:hypothetical protein
VTHSFGWFKWAKHARHAYNIICHFWKNPPHYIDVAAYREAASAMDKQHQEAAKKRGEEQKVKNKLDVNKAKEVLSLVNETAEMQKETMKQLAEQGEQLDRIEDKLGDIHDNLKRADHLMKGIESMPYYLFGGSTKKEVNEKREKQKKDRTIKVPEGSPPVIEIDGLFKNGDTLDPCTIVFNAENFQIINPKTDKLFTAGTQYSYMDVETITIKIRNEYFDIAFNTKKKAPLTLCSAYRQIIANQLHTRALREGHDVTVHFPHGSMKFEFKDEWIFKIPPEKRGTGSGKTAANQAFQKLSSLFTDDDTKRDAEEIDRTLDQVSNIVGGIIVAGKATNVVIKQQTEQIKGLETMTDSATDKMRNLGERMDKQG